MYRLFAILLFAAVSQSASAFPSYASGGFRGANLMSSDEIKGHISRLMSMQTLPECEAYMDSHEQELQQRAAAQHVTLPEKGGDPCKVVRFFGRIE